MTTPDAGASGAHEPTAAGAGNPGAQAPTTPDTGAPGAQELTAEQAAATMTSRRYIALLVMVAVIGVIVSFATWGFLELIHQVTQELYTHLPHALGYDKGPPVWWPLPVLAIAGVIVALAITRLPGNGGHLPALGFGTGKPVTPPELPGVLLAGLAGIGFGIVLGPEAPLMALGPALAVIAIMLVRRDTPPQALQIVGAAGAFAAISFLFVSPLVAAVLMIEVTGIGGSKLPLVIIPGLLAAGIGSLLAIGLGSWTGLNRSAIALGPLSHLPSFTRPTVAEFGWTIALALVVAVVAHLIIRGGLTTDRLVTLGATRRVPTHGGATRGVPTHGGATRGVPTSGGATQRRFAAPLLLLLPIIGLMVAGLAIAFSQATGKSVNEALFSGESGLAGLVSQAGTWSVSALVLLLIFKGLAYSLSLGSFRGGPTFPGIFLGAAGGILASHLPGFPLTPAVAVGMGAAVAAILRLPLSAIVLATLLTVQAGTGDEPLIIVGVVVAYLMTLMLSARARAQAPDAPARAAPPPATSPAPR
jgi:H+/Cl- antiporter ClcA